MEFVIFFIEFISRAHLKNAQADQSSGQKNILTILNTLKSIKINIQKQ